MILTGKTLTLDGPSGPLTLGRDPEGVIRVEAARFGDLAFGLGWAHAHDRLSQMVLFRLIGRGETAEHLSGTEELAQVDILMRRMGMRRDAREQVASLSDSTRAWLDTYCDGVNHHLRTRRRPLELLLVGHRPDPWTVEDVLLTMKLVSFTGLAQSQGLLEKFIVQSLLSGVPLAGMRELFRPHLDGLDPAWLEGLTLAEPLIPPAIPWLNLLPTLKASNNWALSGSRTASGLPIFCNDPHLVCDQLPPVFHEVLLTSGGTHAMGVTIPGVPGMLTGRNPCVAWGVTYGFMDQIDFFIEDCRDGKFRRGGEWVPFDTREEVVRLRGGGERRIRIHENLHGVLEGDPFKPGRYLCRAWSAHRGVIARTAEHLVALLRASGVREAMEATRGITISFNWIMADREGNIGYQQSGTAPRRAPGVSGLHPVPGWDPAYDWQGWVDPGELHSSFNPECGFLATANDHINPPGGPAVVNVAMGHYRLDRIRSRLAASNAATVHDMQRLQTDLHSPQASEFLAVLRPFLPDSPEGRALAGWNCDYAPGATEPSRFEFLYRELLKVVFGEAAFGPAVIDFAADETLVLMDYYMQFDRALMDPASSWFAGRDRDQLIRQAVERAFARPVLPWGQTSQVMMRNFFFQGALPAFLGFDHGPVVIGGCRATVWQGAIFRNLGYPMTCNPTYRFITDLSRVEAHTALAGGPSGNRFSRWYKTDVERWQRGTYKILRPGTLT